MWVSSRNWSFLCFEGFPPSLKSTQIGHVLPSLILPYFYHDLNVFLMILTTYIRSEFNIRKLTLIRFYFSICSQHWFNVLKLILKLSLTNVVYPWLINLCAVSGQIWDRLSGIVMIWLYSKNYIANLLFLVAFQNSGKPSSQVWKNFLIKTFRWWEEIIKSHRNGSWNRIEI